MKLEESTDRKHYCRFLFKILTVNFKWFSFRRQSVTFCWLMSNRSDWCNVALSPKAERELVGGKRHFFEASPCCQVRRVMRRPCILGLCPLYELEQTLQAGELLPRASNVGSPPLLHTAPPPLHHSQQQPHLTGETLPSPSPPPPPPPPLLWLLSMTHRGHHVTVANFWAAAKFEEEGGFRWSFQCTFGASAAAGPLKAAETRGWISTGGPPPRPRLGRLATSSYFQPHAKQGPRGLKGGARGVESWERGAGANGRSAKRGNRTVLDCVEPKVWVKEEADGDKKGEKSGQTVSKIVGPTYSCHRQLVSQRQPTSN